MVFWATLCIIYISIDIHTISLWSLEDNHSFTHLVLDPVTLFSDFYRHFYRSCGEFYTVLFSFHFIYCLSLTSVHFCLFRLLLLRSFCIMVVIWLMHFLSHNSIILLPWFRFFLEGCKKPTPQHMFFSVVRKITLFFILFSLGSFSSHILLENQSILFHFIRYV